MTQQPPKNRKALPAIWSLTQNPLGRLQPIPMDIEAVKRQGWRDQKILVINEHDQRLDFVEREFIRRLGDRLYGPASRKGDQHRG